MSTLYIDRKYTSLEHQGAAMVLRRADQGLQRIPFNLIDRVVVHGKVQTDTATLGALADAGIAVSLLTGRHGRYKASLVGPAGNDVLRRVAQYRAHEDQRATTDIARCILRRKLAGQQRLLTRALAQRQDLRHSLRKASGQLQALRLELKKPEDDLDRLRGIEGAAAAAYFAAYQKLFPPSLGFQGRKRRPPPDPVNAVLSLGYTLLYSEAVKAVHAAGLDPFLGYLHAPAHGRASLAADLIEPLRPRFDSLVWWMFSKRQLRAEDFKTDDGGCLLSKSGRGRFYGLYEKQAAPTRRWLRLFTYALINHLTQQHQRNRV